MSIFNMSLKNRPKHKNKKYIKNITRTKSNYYIYNEEIWHPSNLSHFPGPTALIYADMETFTAISNDLAKDKNNVYFKSNRIPLKNTKNIKYIGNDFWQNKNVIFYD